MLQSCGYAWHPLKTVQHVRRRILQQGGAGTNLPDKIRSWYDLAGGAGFLLSETGAPGEINALYQLYIDLMDWDGRAYPAGIARGHKRSRHEI